MTTATTKKLYRWNWTSGGYNQCHAFTKREARKIGTELGKLGGGVTLTIDEKTFRLVTNEPWFWKTYPIFD